MIIRYTIVCADFTTNFVRNLRVESSTIKLIIPISIIYCKLIIYRKLYVYCFLFMTSHRSWTSSWVLRLNQVGLCLTGTGAPVTQFAGGSTLPSYGSPAYLHEVTSCARVACVVSRSVLVYAARGAVVWCGFLPACRMNVCHIS